LKPATLLLLTVHPAAEKLPCLIYYRALTSLVRDVINLDEKSLIRSIHLSYLEKENITPKLEIYNFVGPEDSQIKQKPMDWNAKFTITAQFF